MKALTITKALPLALTACLAWGLSPTLAAPPDACTGGVPNVEFGDGSDDVLTVGLGSHHDLEPNKNYRHVIVRSGGTLDTQGNPLRVCGTLTNEGIVTDTVTGGPGGNGGAHGKGHDPCEDDTPPHCSLQPLCTEGEDGNPGDPPSITQPGQNGYGGRGGGGGGGGGGAWRVGCVSNYDADGGNGGDGREGGKGGGYVLIWAYRVENNNDGVIHADGEPGVTGENAAPANGCPCQNNDCGPEHCEWGVLPPRDISGGGGGGGGGGAGGNGGTVDIHYCSRVNDGIIQAEGGPGGTGGQDAGSPCCNSYGAPAIDHGYGCDGGAPNGGDGGDGEHEVGCAGDGDAGGTGSSVDGSVRWFFHCPGYDHNDFDVRHYKLDLTIDPDTQSIDGTNIMQVECLADNLTGFGFRLDEQAFGADTQVYIGTNGLWDPLTDWDWADDQKTVCVALDGVYDHGEVFYLRVDYAGNPRDPVIVPGEVNINGGMLFTSHGEDEDEEPMVFTVVSPWFAYLWWPVKDDGDNWNCDKATADLWFTVPTTGEYEDWVVLSNGVFQGQDNLGDQKRFRWSTEEQTAAYLVCFAATNYNRHVYNDCGCTHSQGTTTIPFEIFMYPWDDGLGLKRTQWRNWVCGNPLRPDAGMIDLFSRLYGVYPFSAEKYGIYEWNNADYNPYIAMEHQTIVGQNGGEYWWLLDHGFRRAEIVTAHELGHQWWGDFVTHATWNDIWLTEGFACYADATWFEHHPFPGTIPGPGGQDTLRYYMRSVRMPDSEATSKSVYCYSLDPADIYDGGAMYRKAPWVLHMLRHLLDPVYAYGETGRFFELLRGYREDRAETGCAGTPDFQAVAEELCDTHGLYDLWATYHDHPGGEEYNDLGWFFEEWVYNGGAPAYIYQRLPSDWDHVRIRVMQVQEELYGDPLFKMPIDIYTKSHGEWTRHIVWNDAASEVYELEASGLFVPIRFDPNGWLLKRWAVPFIPGLLSDLGATSSSADPASGVNSLSQVAAGLDGGSGEERAFLWLAEPYYGLDSWLTNLGTLENDTSSVAYDVNDAGQIVGQSVSSNGSRAFLWVPEPTYGLEPGMHELDSVYCVAAAHSINDIGQVVGYAGDDQDDYHAVIWQYDFGTGGLEAIDLPTLGGNRSQAWAVNNNGLVAGWSEEVTTNGMRAVIWEYEAESDEWVITPLGTSGPSSAAYDINDAGQVVGQAVGQAKRWSFNLETEEWDWVELPCPATLRSGSVAYGINNRGQSVGECDGHACMWEDDVVTDLNDYLRPMTTCGLLASGWDINDAGQIVGYREVEGQTDGWLFFLNPGGVANCNTGGVLDACDILAGTSQDCQPNGFPDECDIAQGFSEDANTDGIPDECYPAWILALGSCYTHGLAGEFCLDIGTGESGPPYDNIEPRLQLGEAPELELQCTLPVEPGSATVVVSCVPFPYAGTATVFANGSDTARVYFSHTLPDESCCTLTFSGDIMDVRTIVMLEGDTDRDCFVTTADGAGITQRLGHAKDETNFWYDVDRDCAITTADGASITGRLGNMAPCPCPCP